MMRFTAYIVKKFPAWFFFFSTLCPKVMPIACPHGIGVQIWNFSTKALSRAVDRAILVSEIGVNLKFLLGSFFLNKNFFFDKRWFLHPILAHLLSFMTNPIPMNIYRVVARQKLRFPTFFQILGIKPVFCEQNFLFW